MVSSDRSLVRKATEDGDVGGLGGVFGVVVALEEEEGEVPRRVLHLHETRAVQQVGDGGRGDLAEAFLLGGGGRGGREGREGEWMIMMGVSVLPPSPTNNNYPNTHTLHSTYQLLLPGKGRLRARRTLAVHSGTGLVGRANAALGASPPGGTVTQTIGLEGGSQGLLRGGGAGEVARPRLVGLHGQDGQEGGEEDKGRRVEKAGHAFLVLG